MSRASKLLSYRALTRVTPNRSTELHHYQQRTHAVAPDAAASSPVVYHNQAALSAAVAKNSVRLTPASLLYSGRAGDPHQVLRFAQYLHRELPVRIAHQVADFQALTYDVARIPRVQHVHELHVRAFHLLSSFPAVKTLEDEGRYSSLLRQMLYDHKDVVTLLAEGFHQRRRSNPAELMRAGFLDNMLSARLGILLLCEHHLAMRQHRQDFVGVLRTKFCPGDLVESQAALVASICELTYGTAPSVKMDGSGWDASFPYIPQPVEYMLTEVLKNAYRATVEYYRGRPGLLPEVRVTVANNDVDFVIRISDRGGGVPHDIVHNIFDYGFSTAEESKDHETFPDRVSESYGTGAMRGFGFGLPVSRAYARYLGGSLTFETMQGVGSDFFLRLRHIDGSGDSFRI